MDEFAISSNEKIPLSNVRIRKYSWASPLHFNVAAISIPFSILTPFPMFFVPARGPLAFSALLFLATPTENIMVKVSL